MNLKRIISIILVVIWMMIIFLFSNQQGEGSGSTSKNVSRIVVNVLDIKQEYTENEKEELIQIIEPYIRKLAHFSIYALGGILIINAARQFTKVQRNQIVTSALIGVLYAVSDELHQLCIAGRSGRIEDVLIDTLGVLTGITVFLLVHKIVERIINKNTKVKEVK